MRSAVVAKTIAIAVALHALFTVSLPWWIWTRTRDAESWRLPLGRLHWLGAPLIAFGVYLYLWSIAHLLARDTSAIPGQRASVLETDGWYGMVRHPLLLGVVAILLGEAIAAQSLALLFYALTYWLWLHVFVVRREEVDMVATFGEAYRAYAARVPRWLPRWRTRRGARSNT